jgi:hypothetical protein
MADASPGAQPVGFRRTGCGSGAQGVLAWPNDPFTVEGRLRRDPGVQLRGGGRELAHRNGARARTSRNAMTPVARIRDGFVMLIPGFGSGAGSSVDQATRVEEQRIRTGSLTRQPVP